MFISCLFDQVPLACTKLQVAFISETGRWMDFNASGMDNFCKVFRIIVPRGRQCLVLVLAEFSSKLICAHMASEQELE